MAEFRNLASKLTTQEVLPPYIVGEKLDLNKPPPSWDIPRPPLPVTVGDYYVQETRSPESEGLKTLKPFIHERMGARGESFMEDIPETEWEKLDKQTENAYEEIRKETRRKRRLLRQDSLMFIKNYEKQLLNHTYETMKYGLLIHDECGKIYRVVHTVYNCYDLVMPYNCCPWCNGDMAKIQEGIPLPDE